jgi:hypothetical protein
MVTVELHLNGTEPSTAAKLSARKQINKLSHKLWANFQTFPCVSGCHQKKQLAMIQATQGKSSGFSTLSTVSQRLKTRLVKNCLSTERSRQSNFFPLLSLQEENAQRRAEKQN